MAQANCTNSFDLLKRPTERALDFVAAQAGDSRRSLLTHLGIKNAKIESFQNGKDSICNDACFKGLVYWLEGNVLDEPVNFGTLFKALEESGKPGLISSLKEKLKASPHIYGTDQDLSTQANIVKASSEVQDAVKLKQVQKELKELKLEKESDDMKAKEQISAISDIILYIMKASSEAIKQIQKELEELKLEKESDHMKAKEQGFTEVCCTSCNTPIAEKTHIIRGMHKDVDGPIYEYTNPAKYKHKTLTVSRAKNFLPQGQAYTEHSWFKGFTWTIITCKTCNCHLGWQFNACNKILDRSRFFGLTMASVEFV